MTKVTASQDLTIAGDGSVAMIKNAGAWLMLSKIDLTGIRQITFVTGGRGGGNGTIELREGSAKGHLLARYTGAYDKNMKIDLPDNTWTADLYFVFNGSPINIRAIKFSESN